MTQERALEILKTGGNIFLTGEPGAGKTHTINQYIAWLEAAQLSVAVTATTGIASTHIGGMTIHSWSGVGVRDNLTQYDLDKISGTEKTSKRVRKAKVLVIDEISMMDRKLLDMINLILKTVRQSNEPFGGMQVVFVGDFFQLPPITKQGEIVHYAFESYAWQEAKPIVCYLSEQHRQEDELFLGLLQAIRRNQVEEDHHTLLSEQTEISYEDIEPTKLYTHNLDVDAFNQKKLIELKGSSHTYKMSSLGSRNVLEGLVRSCLSPETLELKEEALVMCTKNNFEKGYVNGTLGKVINFDKKEGWPIVQTADGRTIKLEPVSWEVVDDGKVRASIEQVPLRLAWAITVHKSQGMSLDAAEIDLSKAFVYGQGYVALSRVRTLAGLKLTGMGPNALGVDPRVIRQDERFRQESESVESAFNEMNEEEVEKMHRNFVTAGGGKIPKPGEVVVGKPHERIAKEHTRVTTKKLLLEGKLPAEIAKERGMVETTIWGHIEDLIAEREIETLHLEPIISIITNWQNIFEELTIHMNKVGTEKLKPIYEAAKEKYDYDTIRLARMIYRLGNRDS